MKNRILVFFLLITLCFCEVTPVYADNNADGGEVNEIEPENLIEISTAEELLAFAEACKLDIYSLGKVVELKSEINISGLEFEGIAYFNGTFHGNGYTIKGMNLKEKGSQQGLFRYIGESGIVADLHVVGAVSPEGTQEEIGGIAGVNYGTIKNCTFTGAVSGQKSVGAIAGINKSYGQILECKSNAIVLATDYTGGIAGVNEGIIDACINESRVNIEELDPVMDLAGMDMSDLNIVQTIVARNNTGGIAGKSSGIIRDCTNYGAIGYEHTGYNVGGIVGYQNGVILNCENAGNVYGRKDIGGIVGQAEPYIASEYLSEQIEQTKNDINRMNRTMNNLSYNLEKNSKEAKVYADALAAQFEGTSGSLSDRFEQMEDAIPQDNPEAQKCMDNINAAMERIEEIRNKEGTLIQDDLDEIERQMAIIEENTERLAEISEEENGNTSSGVSGNTQSPETQNNVQGLVDSLQKSMDSLTNGLNALTNQTEAVLNHLEDSTAVIRGEKSYIVDVSSIKTAAEMDGVISGCVNRGMVEADLNVGGIAGTMNIEYGDDPEADLDLSEDLDIAMSSEVNNVIIDSINYASVNGKKSGVGSVVGLQEMGLLYHCEGYGHVNAATGTYAGGIAGKSSGTIEKSYAMLDVTAQDYVGGIAGEGNHILNCLSVVTIDTDGERIGAVAGYFEEEGTISGNYFVKDAYEAIDDISYAGVAEMMSYEEMMQFEDIPEGFTQVQVAFEIEDELICETTVAYGSSLTEANFPTIAEKEGYYVVWPEESVYTDICNNLTVTAEYVPWTQSVAAGTKASGKPLFIAVGEFYEGTELHILEEETDFPVTIEEMNVLYSHDWTILSEREKNTESVEGHFYVPASVEGEVSVWIESEGGWVAVPTTIDGSYVVADIPYETAFAVVELMPDMTGTYLTIGAVVVLILVISIVIVHNKRKKKAK